jgi:hypothetical protein
VDAKTFVVVSVSIADMLAYGMMKALPEPRHTMILRRKMRAVPNGDYFACIITANDIEGLL